LSIAQSGLDGKFTAIERVKSEIALGLACVEVKILAQRVQHVARHVRAQNNAKLRSKSIEGNTYYRV
jgi:preprotein translocase subunit YajC